MDLSPWQYRRGQSHFRGDQAGLLRHRPPRRENWDSPRERLHSPCVGFSASSVVQAIEGFFLTSRGFSAS